MKPEALAKKRSVGWGEFTNTYNTTLGISAEYGDFTFGVAAKYGFGTDDRSNAGVKINATYAF